MIRLSETDGRKEDTLHRDDLEDREHTSMKRTYSLGPGHRTEKSLVPYIHFIDGRG